MFPVMLAAKRSASVAPEVNVRELDYKRVFMPRNKHLMIS